MFWIKKGPHTDIIVRVALTLLSCLASIAITWYVFVSTHAAHASTPTIRETVSPSPLPWGISFDTHNNAWIAEPGCDPQPTCSTQQPPGAIAQYNRQNFALLQNYAEPTGYSPPLFLATDASGNIWFTEPTTNAIGELSPNNGNPTWNQWTVPTPSATPYDLTFDKAGNLWFTELNASNIGEFTPSTQQFVETATPTANSSPYGIVGPDPGTGSIWFTENNSAISQIGRFTPPASGTLNTSDISEYLTQTRSNSTPHLLAFDTKGNIWWTEGFDGNIGRLVISQAVNGTSNGVTEYAVPPPTCTPNSNCGVHLSGIGVDSKGTVWFDDSLSSRIGSYVPGTNTFTMTVVEGSTSSNAHPHDGLAVDQSDNVWFTEEFASKVGEVLSTPTGPPVNQTWYFGEGRIGSGFTEYLTIDNPDRTQTCAVTITYDYTVDGKTPAQKTLALSIPPSTRTSRQVNGDLGIPPFQKPGASVSSIVAVNTSMTPNCNGVVAERPMYVSNTVKSGNDALGVTSPGQNFYFADIPTGGGFASYLTILNPGSSTANVTATYYANGKTVTSQQLAVAGGTRGTILPNNAHLPLHVAAIITANQPIVVERPDYFTNVAEGNAGIVSGTTCITGTASLSSDWLFAEGYTATGFQEYLVIANIDTAAQTSAVVTIKLEYENGSSRTFPVTVNSMSQLIWPVPNNGSTQGVSADVSATGAKIIVERQMFFQDHLHGYNLTAIGGTDVVGEMGPVAASAYSFSEGYVGNNYNEFLTLQNPTSGTETLQLTLVNGYGRTYTQAVSINATTRMTLDIAALALRYLVHRGDGTPGYTVSMVIQSVNSTPFVAERPMYWNEINSGFPTQGGDDIIGYTG